MIQITADSACDLSPNLLERMGIALMPMPLLVDDKEYRDGVDITSESLFQYVKEGKACRTSAANIHEYAQFFNQVLQRADAVVHFSMSSGFSANYQNACLAAQNVPQVYVVDTKNLSTGSGHLVLDAAEMAAKGMPVEEIIRASQETSPLVEASFVIDSVDYLRRGGRCSGLEAIGSKVLRIKPCIEVKDGRMHVGKKYRGSFHKALSSYVRDRLESRSDIDYHRVFITHPMCKPEIVQCVRDAINQHASFDEIIETKAGCTISNHCGSNTLGILFKRKKVTL